MYKLNFKKKQSQYEKRRNVPLYQTDLIRMVGRAKQNTLATTFLTPVQIRLHQNAPVNTNKNFRIRKLINTSAAVHSAHKGKRERSFKIAVLDALAH